MKPKRPAVSPGRKAVARAAAAVFGGEPHVGEYLHDTERLAIDVLSSEERPRRGVTSYATVGLAESAMLHGEGEFPIRIELVGACASADEDFPHALTGAAFRVMQTGQLLFPGAVLEDHVTEYVHDALVPHLCFLEPFLWPALTPIEIDGVSVHWLLALPITKTEAEYLEERGAKALEALFKQKRTDLFNLRRPSAV
jgi:hypothetical protein